MKSYKMLQSPGKQRSMRFVTSPSKISQSSPSRFAAVDILISSQEKTKPQPAPHSMATLSPVFAEALGDSDEELGPEFYCTVCRKEFTSNAQLDRHIKYSSMHSSHLASDGELAKAVHRSLEVWNKANSFISAIEESKQQKMAICAKYANDIVCLKPVQNRYRLLWKIIIRKALVEVSVRKLNERIMNMLTRSRVSVSPVILLLRHTKIFWKHRLNVTTFMYLHEVKHPASAYSKVIEIVSYDNHNYCEISRIYCDFCALVTHLKSDIECRILRKTYETLRISKEAVVISPEVHQELTNEACTAFLVARLNIDASVRTVLETLAICFLPTDNIYVRESLVLCRWKAAKILKPVDISSLLPPRSISKDVIKSATIGLEKSTADLSRSTQIAMHMSQNVEQTLQQLFDEHRNQSEIELFRGKAPRSLWRKAIVHEIASSLTTKFRCLLKLSAPAPEHAQPVATSALAQNAAPKSWMEGSNLKKQSATKKLIIAEPTPKST